MDESNFAVDLAERKKPRLALKGKPVVVIGMHGSGTSSVSNALVKLGV